MYLDHFGLREAPFRITPHTEFFFAGANRGATLEALIYAITHEEGIVKVSGEVGSGKTMLCRMLLEKLPENVVTVYLANPSLSRKEILHAIAGELQTLPVQLAEGSTHQLMRELQETLLDIYAKGKIVVVMIDEAHAMPLETLEEIRLLSNLESNKHKLLHIVLFGQPELDDRLNTKGMRQLKERITHNFALEPLRRNDVASYLMFRIRAAGYHGPDLFTPGAIQLIFRASEGLTRRINILGDKALLSAFAENRHLIDRKQIRAAVRDAQFNPMRESDAQSRKWALGIGLVIAAGASAFVVGRNFSDSTPELAQTPSPAVQGPSVPEPGRDESAPTDAVAAIPVQTAPTPETKTPAPAQPAPPLSANESPEAKAVTPSPPETDQSPTIQDRFAATAEWLATTPGDHFFIQLVSTGGDNERDLEAFLDSKTKGLEQAKIRVYRSDISGRVRLGAIYGDYASFEEASAELATIKKLGFNGDPYIRTVRKLR